MDPGNLSRPSAVHSLVRLQHQEPPCRALLAEDPAADGRDGVSDPRGDSQRWVAGSGGAALDWTGSLTAAGLSHRLCRAADRHDGSHQGAEPQPGHPLLGVQALCDSYLLPQGTHPPTCIGHHGEFESRRLYGACTPVRSHPGSFSLPALMFSFLCRRLLSCPPPRPPPVVLPPAPPPRCPPCSHTEGAE